MRNNRCIPCAILTENHLTDPNATEIETDSRGICPASIRSALENWPTSKPKPKVLYTVPVSYHISFFQYKTDSVVHGKYGSNPTGTTATLERRLEILELARLHDFFILEGMI